MYVRTIYLRKTSLLPDLLLLLPYDCVRTGYVIHLFIRFIPYPYTLAASCTSDAIAPSIPIILARSNVRREIQRIWTGYGIRYDPNSYLAIVLCSAYNLGEIWALRNAQLNLIVNYHQFLFNNQYFMDISLRSLQYRLRFDKVASALYTSLENFWLQNNCSSTLGTQFSGSTC